ncbi:MAG: phosphatidate cytidylyltransferase [Paracoccus sp. (in: a-proteobacteria)]
MENDQQGEVAKTGGQDKWNDLRTRIISGAILAVLGIGLLLSSGIWLQLGVSVLTGLMMWELARMTSAGGPGTGDPRHALLVGGLSGAVMLVSLLLPGIWGAVLAALPILAGWRGTAERHRIPFVIFTLGFFGASYGLFVTRAEYGLLTTFWIAGTVVISDIAGYFAGRMLGGPKFWPKISPKKTWSGTIAGWIGAAIFALILILASGSSNWSLLIAGPFVALAGQFGDIAESWLKRRVGIKDSSNLIPGHGGVMDRFDAMSGAFLSALILFLLGL